MGEGYYAYSIDIADDCCKSGETGPSTWDDADVFIGILARLSLSISVVVQMRHCLA